MTQPQGAIPAVDAAEAADRLSRADAPKPLLVDVRELDEFRAVRIEGAALLPMSSFAERHAELPKDRPLLVMCAGGTRSAAATAFLLRGGWTDVVNVEGGITAWQRQGLPVRHGDPAPGEGDLPAG
jgi:rhodanese-related sulfurtransferase